MCNIRFCKPHFKVLSVVDLGTLTRIHTHFIKTKKICSIPGGFPLTFCGFLFFSQQSQGPKFLCMVASSLLIPGNLKMQGSRKRIGLSVTFLKEPKLLPSVPHAVTGAQLLTYLLTCTEYRLRSIHL